MILRPYQETGRDFLAGRRFALLADAMRIGKSAQAILAAEKIGARKILVICPAIAVEPWRREFLKWQTPQGITPQPDIVSYDMAKRHSEALLRQQWDVLVLDEMQYCKNPAAARTKLALGKDGLAWRANRVWALSGTPMPNHPGELFPLLKAFGVTPLSYSAFVHRYCTLDIRFQPKSVKKSAIPELRAMLDSVMLRRTRLDVAPEMPDIDFQFLAVEPLSHADLDVPAGLDGDVLLEWVRANEDKDDRIAVAKAKALPLIENICFNFENELLKQCVVFGWHTEPLQALCEGLRRRGIRVEMITGATSATRRVEIQDDFRLGKIQVVLGNIIAAGTAIDLSSARHAYFLELSWVGADNLQAANRLVSMLKMDKVTCDVLSWPGSYDDRVQRTLLRKMQGVRAMGLA